MKRNLSTLMLAGLACVSPLGAQGVLMPASDPVTLARAGAGVAFGRSLEATSLNPALLPTLKTGFAFQVGGGINAASSQQTLMSSGLAYYSDDRNRAFPSLTMGWRPSDQLGLGLSLNAPYLRHGELPLGAPSRFFGNRLELRSTQILLHGAWAIREDVSVGIGAGLNRIQWMQGTTLRLPIPADFAHPDQGFMGLVETGVRQEAKGQAPVFQAGFRWAISTRWTLGASFISGPRLDLDFNARIDPAMGYTSSDGFGLPPAGTDAQAAILLKECKPLVTRQTLTLPSISRLGIRQRLNQYLTWELDLYHASASRLPQNAQVQTPSGLIQAAGLLPQTRAVFGLALAGEYQVAKNWLLRAGFGTSQPDVEGSQVEPLWGGARTASFSGGVGWQLLGGELSFSYLYQQSQDQDNPSLDQVWTSTGSRSSLVPLRVENMRHAFSMGFRITF